MIELCYDYFGNTSLGITAHFCLRLLYVCCHHQGASYKSRLCSHCRIHPLPGQGQKVLITSPSFFLICDVYVYKNFTELIHCIIDFKAIVNWSTSFQVLSTGRHWWKRQQRWPLPSYMYILLSSNTEESRVDERFICRAFHIQTTQHLPVKSH